MAPALAPVPGLSLNAELYQGRLTGYVLWATIVAGSGGLLFGYDIGVTGGVTSMPDFLEKFFPDVYVREQAAQQSNYCKFDNQLLQLFTSSLFIAGMVGAFIGSYTTSKFGRVKTMLLAGIFFVLGAGLTGGAVHLAMLVLGRISLGLGVGLANQCVPLYLVEMAPAKRRGALNMLFQQATTIGILVAQCINYATQTHHPWGWRISLGLAGVPAIALTLGGIFLPESPNSLIERNKLQEGREILAKARGVDWDAVEAEYEDILLASMKAREVQHPWANICRPEYRPELCFAIMVPFLQQLTGINAIMFYVAPFLSTLGFGENAALWNAIITGGVNVVATVFAIWLVDSIGRKPLFLQGGIQMVICQVAVGFILAFKFNNNDPLPATWATILVVMICLYVAAFAWSWGPLGWLVPSEVQPLETRSAGLSITVAVNFLFTFIIGQAFLSMLCGMRYGIFFFFAGWVIFMTFLAILFVPEAKGVPLEEMPAVWLQHWYWKRWVPVSRLAQAREKKDLEGGRAAMASKPVNVNIAQAA